MNIIIQYHGILLYVFAALFGCIVGSFLAMVIARYPKILYQRWQSECREFLGLAGEQQHEKLSLALPRSHCPHCKQKLKFYHNIPLLSYLCLRGKCAFCHRPISGLYPSIELLSGILSMLVLWRFGVTWVAAGSLIFTYFIIVLCFIDFRHQILPDNITLSCLWLGLMVNSVHLLTTLSQAVWATVVGYLLLWITAWIFYQVRHKQGMGHGDFKMMAAVGAWLGIYGMVNTLLLAVIVGIVLSFVLIFLKRVHWDKPIPFGPFIGIAAWVTLLVGPFIMLNLLR